MSDKRPANHVAESVSVWEAIQQRIRAMPVFRMLQPKTMEELEKESPELAKYISKLENRGGG